MYEAWSQRNNKSATIKKVVNKFSVLENLRDWFIGPELEKVNHNSVLMLIGDDFEHKNTSKQFDIQEMVYDFLANDSEFALGVKI
jgi:hypothetical protein